MSVGQIAVASATAAVFADEQRTGSAVLVDTRHLITADHVLQQFDPNSGDRVAMAQVELEFLTPAGGQPRRATASRVDLGPASVGVDVAVLDLGENPAAWLPAPVAVWPAVRMPPEVQVFGYPLAEGPLNGVWRRFEVAGPVASGAVQLDWVGDAGTFPGHSGGPVVATKDHSLAGILVQGSREGRFDRFIPITLIVQVWPQLPRRWLITGVDQAEARSHFTRRARGQRSVARGGDLFRGRQAAVSRLRKWLIADQPPSQPLVVTGQPGCGKSAVLARAALSVEAEHRGPGLAFHARAATINHFLTAVADLTGTEPSASTEELIAAFGDLSSRLPIRMVADALDEAASDLDRQQLTEALAELAVLPGLRVAVATRPLSVGNPYGPDGILAALGVTSRDDNGLVDLDNDRYFDLDGLYQFAFALLGQEGMDHPGPPGRAWTRYRADRLLCGRLASVIANRAGRNFLVAAMAADPLSRDIRVLDPSAEGFDPTEIPSGVGEALRKYLDRLPEPRRDGERGLLTALAYGRGTGLEDSTWLAFAEALGYSAALADLDTLRRSPAADYLLQATTTERGARPVTRLFHQALADELLAGRHRPSDESALLDILLEQAAHTGWGARYLQEHMAEHAADAGRLDQLLQDPGFLVAADPTRLLRTLPRAGTGGRQAAGVYWLAVYQLRDRPVEEAAAYLELAARQQQANDLAAGIEQLGLAQPWSARWAVWEPTATHHITGRHSGAVRAVAVGELDGRLVAVSGGDDRMVRVWDLGIGQPMGQPLSGHTLAVRAVAIGELRGRPVVVSGGDQTVRVWDLATGQPVGEPFTGQASKITALAIGQLRGRPVVISGGHDARVWSLATGHQDGAPFTGHTGGVRAVAVGKRQGRSVVVSAGGHRLIRVWDLASRQPVGEPLSGHRSAVNALAIGQLDGSPVVVSGGDDRTVRVWDLASGQPVGEPLTGHIGPVCAVAVGTLDDRPVAVSGGGGDDRTIWIWDLATGHAMGEPLTGHVGYVFTVAVGTLDGRPVAVSGAGGRDSTVRVWDLRRGRPTGTTHAGHIGWVHAVAVGELDGRRVVVSGGDDRTVRVWDLASGQPVGEPLTGHTGPVHAVATGTLDGRSVAVSGGDDRTVRVWDLASGQPVGEPLTSHTGPVMALAAEVLDNQLVTVSCGYKEMLRVVWDRRNGKPTSQRLTGHTGWVNAVAVGELDGRRVVVSGGGDRTVRMWDLASGQPVAKPLGRHIEPVRTVAIGDLEGRPVAVSGGDDRTVRVWDLASGQPVSEPLKGHRSWVWAVAAGRLNGRPVVVSGGADQTVRVWDPLTHQAQTIEISAPILAITYVSSGIVVATRRGLALLQMRPDRGNDLSPGHSLQRR